MAWSSSPTFREMYSAGSRYTPNPRFLDLRKAKSEGLRRKHPDRLPVICERVRNSDLPDVSNSRFLVPIDFTIGNFISIIRSRMEIGPEKAVFLFVDNTVLPSNALLGTIYNERKDPDGFLYLSYSSENTFGLF